MEDKYREWIDLNYPDSSSGYGKCKEACEAMKAAFPELIITNGFVEVFAWNCNDRQHWWLKTKDQEIIDPTRKQFPGLIEYREIEDDHPARNYPTCKCMNCGEVYFGTSNRSRTVCSPKCAKELEDYYNGK